MFRSSLFCFADSMKMYMFTEIINYIFLIGGATLQHYQVPTEVQLPSNKPKFDPDRLEQRGI